MHSCHLKSTFGESKVTAAGVSDKVFCQRQFERGRRCAHLVASEADPSEMEVGQVPSALLRPGHVHMQAQHVLVLRAHLLHLLK